MRLSSPFKSQARILCSAFALVCLNLLLLASQHNQLASGSSSSNGRLKNEESFTRNRMRPPRGYCAPVSQAVPSSSLCYDHLNELAGDEKQAQTDSDDAKQNSETSNKKLVYVRLETLGSSLQKLHTKPVNELLARGVFQLLGLRSLQENSSVASEHAHSRSSSISADILTQISGGLTSSEPEEQRLAKRCRASMEKFLCALAYPSCHFRRADVSALVRPPCREDCLLLKEKLCSNLNWSKFSSSLREAFNRTLKGAINALDLESEGALAGSTTAATLTTTSSLPNSKEPFTDHNNLSFISNSIHFYWPHEHSIERCQSLPPLRPAFVQQQNSTSSNNHKNPLHSIKWPICSSAGLNRLPTVQATQSGNNNNNNNKSITSSDCLYSDAGIEYKGKRNHTKSGFTCQSWFSQTPHKHTSSELLFDNMKDAHNYCRNPGGLELRPWCYTNNEKIRWEYCEIQSC